MKKPKTKGDIDKVKLAIKPSAGGSAKKRSRLQPKEDDKIRCLAKRDKSKSSHRVSDKEIRNKSGYRKAHKPGDLISVILRDFHTNQKIRLHRRAETVISLRFSMEPTIKRIRLLDQPEQLISEVNKWQLYIADYDQPQSSDKGFYHMQFIAQCENGCFHLVDRLSLSENEDIRVFSDLIDKSTRIIKPGDQVTLNMASLSNILDNPDFKFLHNMLTLYNKRRDGK